MIRTASLLAALLIAAASACAAHGPITPPLTAADTVGLPEARATERPPLQTALVVPDHPLRQLRDTIAIRYVLDTLGIPDSRTFTVIRGRDRGYVDALKAAAAKMRFTPARDHGRPVRCWMTVEMRPGSTGPSSFAVQFY